MDYIKTSRKYKVSKPDKDGEICIELNVDIAIWLTKEDVLLSLSRFDE